MLRNLGGRAACAPRTTTVARAPHVNAARCGAALLLAVAAAPAQAEPQITSGESAWWPAGETVKGGPACAPQNISFASGSSWALCVAAVSRFALVVQQAGFRTSAAEERIAVLADARLGEIFVPYHPGFPRFGDISGFNFPTVPMSVQHCPSPRVILNGRICRETRDSGVAFMDDALVRRGEEVVYWAVLDAANYNYIVEFSFRDDGTIGARAGSTGPKLGGPDDETGHMHNFTWRLDFDIDGATGDEVYAARHVEDLGVIPSSAMDMMTALRTEGGRTWNDRQFSTYEVGDRRLSNRNGRPTRWGIVPTRRGTARHTETLFDFDFWVTAANPGEMLARDLATFVADGESVYRKDVVVWYTQTAHHHEHMRDEDRDTVPLVWTGFEIQPQNLFERTPFYR